MSVSTQECRYGRYSKYIQRNVEGRSGNPGRTYRTLGNFHYETDGQREAFCAEGLWPWTESVEERVSQ